MVFDQSLIFNLNLNVKKFIKSGAQYNVFKISNSRVLKEPLDTNIVISKLKSWGWSDQRIARQKNSLIYTRTHSLNYISKLPQKSQNLFGNIQKTDSKSFTQDLVAPLDDIFYNTKLSNLYKLEIFDKYIELNYNIWKYGIFDKVFKFTSNYGLNSKQQVIFIDFGEITNSYSLAAKYIKIGEWKNCRVFYSLKENIKKNIYKKTEESFTMDNLNKYWKKNLN